MVRRGGRKARLTCGVCLHLLQLYSFEPRVSGFVNLLRHDPSVASVSLSPSTSRLISSIGSTVDVMVPHLSHFTSLCSWPKKVVCMIQLHETFVDPREVAWIWFSAVMKNSWASCCA